METSWNRNWFSAFLWLVLCCFFFFLSTVKLALNFAHGALLLSSIFSLSLSFIRLVFACAFAANYATTTANYSNKCSHTGALSDRIAALSHEIAESEWDEVGEGEWNGMGMEMKLGMGEWNKKKEGGCNWRRCLSAANVMCRVISLSFSLSFVVLAISLLPYLRAYQ